MLLSALGLFAGLLLLYAGSDSLIRGSTGLGLRFGLSPLVVGLTIVAFATSAPELAVTISAGLSGQPDMAIGNIVGSNIANTGLILGIAAIITPLTIHIRLIRIDIPIMILASVLFCSLLIDGELSGLDGMVLLGLLLAFIGFNLCSAKRASWRSEHTMETALDASDMKIPTGLMLTFTGIALLALGGQWLITGAVNIARWLGLSEAAISLTLIAAGTSLPELATSTVAATCGKGDIAIGNVIGSNIFNLLCVAGAGALTTPLLRGNVGWADIAIMMCYLISVLPFAWPDYRLGRRRGVVLLVAYVAYLIWLLSGI